MARNPHASYESGDHQRMPVMPNLSTAVTTLSSKLNSSVATGTINLIQYGKMGIYNFDITLITDGGSAGVVTAATGLPGLVYPVQGMCAVFAQTHAISSYALGAGGGMSIYAPHTGRYIFCTPVILA